MLQLLRILKNYDLLKSGQLDLFTQVRRRKAAAAPPDQTGELSPTEIHGDSQRPDVGGM